MTTLSDALKAAAATIKNKTGITAEEAKSMINSAVAPVQAQAADNSAKIQQLVDQL